MISFIVPAHNEEAEIGPSLRALFAAAEALGEPFEVLVVDDASTDRTAEIARSLKASVVPVNFRNISSVRNAGAKAAKGDALFFVDADTRVPAETLASSVEALRRGAVGGGARVRFEEGASFWANASAAMITEPMRWLSWAAGCFLFARREAFDAAGGFDESYFASEEIHLSRALKRRGPFVIVSPPVVTSARKTRLFSPFQLLGQLLLVVATGGKALKRRGSLGLWYSDQRGPKVPGRKE